VVLFNIDATIAKLGSKILYKYTVDQIIYCSIEVFEVILEQIL
jgi:hypothetical protein